MVIFAMGVLTVIQLNSTLAARMTYAGRTSAIVVLTHARLDSLESMPFDSITTGTATDTVSVQGLPYIRTADVSAFTGLVYAITVSMAPVTAGTGPSYSADSYIALTW